MVKFLLAIITALMLLFVSPFKEAESKLKVTADYPKVIKPGTEFTVLLSVHKSKISGTARLQQYLPNGFTASEGNSQGADFIFEEQNVKFLWSNLPKDDDFTISYKIKTEGSVSGLKIINGLFVYLDDDKTVREAIPPVEIKFDNTFVGSTTGKSPEVARKLINIAPEKGEYRVELTIRTNNVREWARFTDEMPEGFTAQLIDAHGADFRVEDNKSVFRWNRLPDEDEFTVSYLVSSGIPGPPPVINGLLVFGNQNQSADELTEEEKPADTHIETEPVVTETAPPDEMPAATTQKADPQQTNESSVQPEPAPRASVASANVTRTRQRPTGLNGILFKVQISATRTSPVKSSSWFNSRYHINTDVELTYHDGWKKYLIGNCTAYREAKELRTQTIVTIPDAFVVAYDNGTRIDVREALNKKSINP
jgi:hypothetical protein